MVAISHVPDASAKMHSSIAHSSAHVPVIRRIPMSKLLLQSLSDSLSQDTQFLSASVTMNFYDLVVKFYLSPDFSVSLHYSKLKSLTLNAISIGL